MSCACLRAALTSRLFAFSARRPREVRSWLTRQSAELPSVAAEALAVGPSVEAHTVAAIAGPPVAATVAMRRRRGKMPLMNEVRIYLQYRVDRYPVFSPWTYVLGSCLPTYPARNLPISR